MPPDPPNLRLRGFTARIVICPGKLIALKPPMYTVLKNQIDILLANLQVIERIPSH